MVLRVSLVFHCCRLNQATFGVILIKRMNDFFTLLMWNWEENKDTIHWNNTTYYWSYWFSWLIIFKFIQCAVSKHKAVLTLSTFLSVTEESEWREKQICCLFVGSFFLTMTDSIWFCIPIRMDIVSGKTTAKGSKTQKDSCSLHSPQWLTKKPIVWTRVAVYTSTLCVYASHVYVNAAAIEWQTSWNKFKQHSV